MFSCLLALSCALLAVALMGAAGSDASPTARDKTQAIRERVHRQPMIFFVAKGEPNACGRGCSEWIAAEGMIDPGAAPRFRDFLGALPRRDLPIFFNSTGGFAARAMELGRILREQRMTVGVGRTVPEGCRQAAAIDEACRGVMMAKREHRSRLVTDGARCLSACVHALVGGSVRQVAPDAQLGIHAIRLPEDLAANVDSVHGRLKRYVVEMGIDPGIIDAAAKVSADRIRYLTREEIARFGIETRGSYETPWIPYEDRSGQLFLLKSITQPDGADDKEYRTSSVRLWCVGAGLKVWFVYRRDAPSNEIGAATVIRVAAGNKELVLGPETKGASERSTIANWEFLQNAMAVPSIMITEASMSQGDVEGRSHVIKLSTNGLSKVLGQLQKGCGELPDPR
jgi:hypothetical protein